MPLQKVGVPHQQENRGYGPEQNVRKLLFTLSNITNLFSGSIKRIGEFAFCPAIVFSLIETFSVSAKKGYSDSWCDSNDYITILYVFIGDSVFLCVFSSSKGFAEFSSFPFIIFNLEKSHVLR
jgi:hypothetical protein